MLNVFGNVAASNSLLFGIAIIIVVAAIFAFVSKALKQELIPAYIIAGIIIGPLVLGLVTNIGIISSLAEIGIAFLLFTAGMEISSSKLKEQAGSSIFSSIFQMVLVGIITFFIAIALHFKSIEAIYLAIILAFSSTVLVVKLLSDKKELNTLHARISIGILLFQDVAAIIVLILINQSFSASHIIVAILQFVLLVLIAVILNRTVLKPLFRFASQSYELLFLATLAFVFIFSILAMFLNLSIIIGAFVAGIALSSLPYKYEIENKIKPLRDFFTITFFVSLGMWLSAFNFARLWLPLIIFLVVMLLVKPLIIAIALRISKYKSRTSLGVGFSLGQISEFSLVIALIAFSSNLISNNVFNLIILLSIIGMAITPYLMRINKFFSPPCESLFSVFKKIPERREFQKCKIEKKTIILVGCHRMGAVFLKGLQKYKDKTVVVDFNPDMIKALENQKISFVYGDIVSQEVLDILPISQAKIVLSTIPNIEDNLHLIKVMKKKNKNIFITLTAEKVHDAIKLYENGADYVIVPSVLSAESALHQILDLSKRDFKKYKQEHLEYLKQVHRYLY